MKETSTVREMCHITVTIQLTIKNKKMQSCKTNKESNTMHIVLIYIFTLLSLTLSYTSTELIARGYKKLGQ